MKHYAVSYTSPKRPARSSIIRPGTLNCRHRPIVLGDARPEDPDHYYREEREQGLEEPAVDLAVGALANVDADNVLEDLSDGEKDSCAK